MDEIIEQKNEMSISEIFAKKGEEFFRIEEQHLLQHISNQQKTVISCGGGTFANQENINIINQKGISVFLNVNSSILEARLKNDTKRPLTQGKQNATQILLKRITFYTQAHIMVDIALNNIEESITKITKEVARHLA
jgi:shikimate kinase